MIPCSKFFYLKLYFILLGTFWLYYLYVVPPLNLATPEAPFSDFIHYQLMIKSFWSDGFSIYKLETHEKVISELLPSGHVAKPMPVALSPTALLLWAPFAFALTWGTAFSQALWQSLCFTLFAYAVLSSQSTFENSRKNRVVFYLLLISIILSSSITSGFILGQTAVWATSLLFILFTVCRVDKVTTGSAVFLLFLLSLKLPYLILGFAVLFFFKKWNAIGSAILTSLVLAVAFTLLLGAEWINDFLLNLSSTSRSFTSNRFQHAFQINYINTFSAAFFSTLGEGSIRISYILGGIAGGMILLFRKVNSKEFSFLASLGVYLLFSPYVGAFEDCLLLLFLVVPLKKLKGITGQHPMLSLSILILLLLLLNFSRVSEHLPAQLLWSCKFTFVSIILVRIREQKPEQNSSQSFE